MATNCAAIAARAMQQKQRMEKKINARSALAAMAHALHWLR
jgi:hypothetical protein